jgi:hypothetical protein
MWLEREEFVKVPYRAVAMMVPRGAERDIVFALRYAARRERELLEQVCNDARLEQIHSDNADRWESQANEIEAMNNLRTDVGVA